MSIKKNATLTKKERKILFRIIAILLIIVGFWITLAPGNGLLSYNRTQKMHTQLLQKNKELNRQNTNLRKEITQLQNDDSLVEKVARHKYGLLKKNEMVYQFPNKKSNH